MSRLYADRLVDRESICQRSSPTDFPHLSLTKKQYLSSAKASLDNCELKLRFCDSTIVRRIQGVL
ncbi:MAG TPA: hypothetical protein VHX86_12800 [Tepidisphaeraceae bacterium]|nr:hypothetical protein [Tepidisphaeraceae bacterium]